MNLVLLWSISCPRKITPLSSNQVKFSFSLWCTEPFLYARHHAKHFSSTPLSNPHSHSMRQTCNRWGNLGLNKLNKKTSFKPRSYSKVCSYLPNTARGYKRENPYTFLSPILFSPPLLRVTKEESGGESLSQRPAFWLSQVFPMLTGSL